MKKFLIYFLLSCIYFGIIDDDLSDRSIDFFVKFNIAIALMINGFAVIIDEWVSKIFNKKTN